MHSGLPSQRYLGWFSYVLLYWYMDKERYIAKQADIEVTFNNLVKEKEQAERRVAEIDTEIVRLQGKHAALQELIDELDKSVTEGVDTPSTEEATTVTAVEKTDEETSSEPEPSN